MRNPLVPLAASVILGFTGAEPARGNERCAESVSIAGDDYSVVIEVPTGWVHDHEADRAPDRRALLHPAGASAENAAAVLYVDVVPNVDGDTLGDLISSDLRRRRDSSPAALAEVGDPLPTSDGSEAPVRRFSHAVEGDFESVAYLRGPTTYVRIVLSSRSEAARGQAQAAFADVVRSCRFPTVVGGIAR